MGFLSNIRSFFEERSYFNFISVSGVGDYEASTRSMHDPSTKESLGLTAYWAAVRLIAESLASIEVVPYKKEGEKRTADKNHPLWHLLNREPNPHTSGIAFMEDLIANTIIHGNGFALIEVKGSKITALQLKPSPGVTIEVNNGVKTYQIDGETYLDNEVLHFRGLGDDGIIGYSPAYLHRNALKLSLQAERYGREFFEKNGRPSGILEVPGALSEDQKATLTDHWGKTYSQGSTAVIDNGMKYVRVDTPHDDAQFLETRVHQVREIARMFRIPPHLLGDLERATFANIEEMSLEFVKFSLRSWAVRFEQALMRALLTENEKKNYELAYDLTPLLQGDQKTRYESHAIGLYSGFLSVNDVRRSEGLNEIEGGDVYTRPLNVGLLEDIGNDNNDPFNRGGQSNEPNRGEKNSSPLGVSNTISSTLHGKG